MSLNKKNYKQQKFKQSSNLQKYNTKRKSNVDPITRKKKIIGMQRSKSSSTVSVRRKKY